MLQPLHVLLVEDNPQDAELLVQALRRAGFEPSWERVDTETEYLARLHSGLDLVLADYILPQFSGLRALQLLKQQGLKVPLIIVSGAINEDTAVAAIKEGAADYLMKDRLARLGPAIGRALEESRLRRESDQTEKALRESETRLRAFGQNSPTIIFIKDAAGRYSFVNQQFEQTYQLTRAQAVGKTDREIFPPEQAAVFQSNDRIVLQTGVSLRFEEQAQLSKGPHIFSVFKFPLRDAEGRTCGLGGIASDITERKQAEESLARERTLLRTIFDLLPDYIYVKDLQSRFIMCNDRCGCSMGAATPQEVVGKTDADFYPAEQAAGFRADELAVLAGTPLIDKEELFTRAGGIQQVVLTTKLPLRDSQGAIIGMVGNGRDITGRKHLEEQLRQSQKMEAIGQLSGGVAHDFNNLLSVIKGHIGLLHVKGLVTPEITESIQQIAGAADRAATLTRQLLTFSRQQVMEPTEVNLNGLVFNLAKMLRRLLSESIELEIECASQTLPIRADEGMVEQVLLNLMVNARDAMPTAGTLRVTTEAVDLDEAAAQLITNARPGEFACLTVSDTGTGIAPEVIPRIFEPFFTTKGIGKGTGLGLTTVYTVMQQHDGWVNVESEVGRGTTFRVYFPRLATELSEALSGKTGSQVRGGHEGILLVEDELAVREIAEVVLSGLGYRVFTAVSGLAALQVWEARKHEIELLLTDLVMPDGITGRGLGLRLRGDNPRLPIIYMSGYSREAAEEGFPLQEGTNYLPKPFDLSSLAKIVRASLDRGVTQPPFALASPST